MITPSESIIVCSLDSFCEVYFSFTAFSGFEKFFPKSEESSSVNKPAEGEDCSRRFQNKQHFCCLTLLLFALSCAIFFLSFKENTKDQESLVSEREKRNDDEDEGQRGGKKDEWYSWTRFQV